MVKKKYKLQCLIFNKYLFGGKIIIRYWIYKNGFIIDKRLKKPILCCGDSFRVRQRNPDWFNKKTFKVESLGRGVKGVYGILKK